MAKVNLSAKEVAELMKLISVGISVKRIIKSIDNKMLISILEKFEKPETSDKLYDKKILRMTEDFHDIDELSNALTEEINLRGGHSNCEECND